MAAANTSIHFRILSDIARDLSGDVNFPICMDAAILVRDTLKDPLVSIERVVQVVSVEPLISSKLLRLANSVSYNPSGKSVTDLAAAIGRLGFEVVRTTSLAVTLDQMLKSRNLAIYDKIAKQAWEHSITVAAIARVLARRVGRISPDDAMLAGLVHDIGIFYLLYRAAEYSEYRDNEPAMIELLVGWHESIGESLLEILDLPEQITLAVRDHDQTRTLKEEPCTVSDVLYFANLLAADSEQGLPGGISPEKAKALQADRERYSDLFDEAQEDILELRAALAL